MINANRDTSATIFFSADFHPIFVLKILRPAISGGRIFSARTHSERRWCPQWRSDEWCLALDLRVRWKLRYYFFYSAFQNTSPPVQYIWSSWLSCEADGNGDTPKF